MNQTTLKKNVKVLHYDLSSSNMIEDIHIGLSKKQKKISPKYFYDEKGSQLFDKITQLPEYYLTRVETQILKKYAKEFCKLLGKDSILFELGSGSSIKIRILLENLRPKVYVPMDISEEHLINSAKQLGADYPWLTIYAACVDYSQNWKLPNIGSGRYNAFFPGSSIGNFEPNDAIQLLQQVAKLVGEQGGLLIGVDLKKEVYILEDAYNDIEGVTAQFNLNLLNHINQQTGTNFNLDNFSHKAIYNAQEGRIEMHLISKQDHEVTLDEQNYLFKEGETIHTENSYKYSIEEFHQLCEKAGFQAKKVWTDDNNLFSIHYLQVAQI